LAVESDDRAPGDWTARGRDVEGVVHVAFVKSRACRRVVSVLDGDVDDARVTGRNGHLRARGVDRYGVFHCDEGFTEPDSKIRAEAGASDESVLPARERAVRRVDVPNRMGPSCGKRRVVSAFGDRTIDEVHARQARVVRARAETEDPFTLSQAAARNDAHHRGDCVTMPVHDA
jgi:hypothetical protein